MLDSRHWKFEDAPASTPFKLDGEGIPTSRTSTRRTWINSAEGELVRTAEGRAWIEGEQTVSLRHGLPDEKVDLSPLIGRRVRVTIVHTAAPDGGVSQTLTINGDDGRLYLVAHNGHVKGNAYTLGKLGVYVALSQRPGGPMVFGTARLQSLVRVGESVRVRDGEELFVMCFQARPTHGNAAYVIANAEVWRERISTP